MTILTAILGALGGALGQLAQWFVGWFVAKKQAEAQAETDMENSISQHQDDGAQSVADANSADAQLQNIQEQEQQLNNPQPPTPAT